MIVYTVEKDYGEYEPCTLIGVFSSKEEAHRFASANKTSDWVEMIVTEWDTDGNFSKRA